MECEDTRKPAKHGKDIVDGGGHVVQYMVKKLFKDNYGDGTQNMVCHLGSKYPRPNTASQTRYFGMRGFYASTQYIYMFLDEGGMDESIVAVEEGYKGSSQDHYY